MYDEKKGKMKDKNNGRKININEEIRRFIINKKINC
jgi:hypothetical protein